MARAHKMLSPRLCLALAVMCATALPVSASVNQADLGKVPLPTPEQQDPQRPQTAFEWLEPTAIGASGATSSGVVPSAGDHNPLLAANGFNTATSAKENAKPGLPERREDGDLNANQSAIERFGLGSIEESLLPENWWQAAPGLLTALVIAIMMYMRNPMSRKRKYRRTPHEPYGRYKKRG